MERDPKDEELVKKRRVRRYSAERLLREPLHLPGGVRLSPEKHNGRRMVRIESPEDEPLG